MHLPMIAVFLVVAMPACARQAKAPVAVPAGWPSMRAAPTEAGDIVTELDNRIFHVFQAEDSAYWFGSDGQGAYRYDGKQVVRFTTAHGLGNARVRGFQEDHAGNLFVCDVRGGVSRFDGRIFRRLTPLDAGQSDWKLDPADLWFPGGQESGVVYRWDGTSLHELAFPKTDAGEAHIAAFPRSKFPNAIYTPYDVYTIDWDSNGQLWFGTAVLGACCYDGTSFTWVGHGENGSFGVRSIVDNCDGTFWLSNTVSRFAEDPNAEVGPSSPRYRKEAGIASNAAPYSVFMSAVRDEDGALWMATLKRGVFCYDGTEWIHFPVTHDGEPIWVYSIYRDRQHDLWLGTHEHGPYKLIEGRFEKFAL